MARQLTLESQPERWQAHRETTSRYLEMLRNAAAPVTSINQAHVLAVRFNSAHPYVPLWAGRVRARSRLSSGVYVGSG
jgi:hypothetical protein